MTGESAALAFDALNLELASMALQSMFHDGQTEARAALVAGTPHVHPIKALREARNVLRRDTDAVVDHREMRALLVGPPTHAYRAVRRRVFQAIHQQIGECRLDLVGG